MEKRARLGKSVAITGHRGFIGRNAFQYFLKNGYYVSGIDKKEGDDLTKLPETTSLLRRYKPKYVINFAAITQVGDGLEFPEKCLKNNIDIIINLCKLAVEQGFKLIHISTDKVYGEGMNKKENSPLRAVYPYDVSKLCCEKIINSYTKTYGMNSLILRPCNVYGTNDDNYKRIIPSIYNALLDKTILELRSDGSMQRDYIYVGDLLEAIELLMDEEGVYNISSGENFSVIEILELVNKILPNKLKYVTLNQAHHEIERQSLSIKKLFKLGYEPKTTMSKFLGEFLCRFQ